MADVFLSYASEDRPRAEAVAEALTTHGWSVWWDRNIALGTDFSQTIERELNAASCVVVLWSAASVQSPYVRDEASDAAAHRVLVPVLITETKPPLGFRQLQTADLSEWRPGESPPELSRLFEAVNTTIHQSKGAETSPREGREDARRPVSEAKGVIDESNRRSLRDGKAATQVTAWWRTHQLVALLLYFVASVLAWQIKEWHHGFADSAFVGVAVLSTIGGFFRGHLLFTERLNPAFMHERLRADPITLSVDLLLAALLAVEGWQLTSARPLAGTLTIALAVGIALTRLVIEPTTTRAAFD